MKCPLCGFDSPGSFPECGACAINSSCTASTCPHCGYRFVEESSLVKLLRRILRRRSPPAADRHSPDPPSGQTGL